MTEMSLTAVYDVSYQFETTLVSLVDAQMSTPYGVDMTAFEALAGVYFTPEQVREIIRYLCAGRSLRIQFATRKAALLPEAPLDGDKVLAPLLNVERIMQESNPDPVWPLLDGDDEPRGRFL